jgi:hypothetical protein
MTCLRALLARYRRFWRQPFPWGKWEIRGTHQLPCGLYVERAWWADEIPELKGPIPPLATYYREVLPITWSRIKVDEGTIVGDILLIVFFLVCCSYIGVFLAIHRVFVLWRRLSRSNLKSGRPESPLTFASQAKRADITDLLTVPITAREIVIAELFHQLPKGSRRFSRCVFLPMVILLLGIGTIGAYVIESPYSEMVQITLPWVALMIAVLDFVNEVARGAWPLSIPPSIAQAPRLEILVKRFGLRAHCYQAQRNGTYAVPVIPLVLVCLVVAGGAIGLAITAAVRFETSSAAWVAVVILMLLARSPLMGLFEAHSRASFRAAFRDAVAGVRAARATALAKLEPLESSKRLDG